MQKFYSLILVSFFFVSNIAAQQVWDNFEDVRKGTYGFINGAFIPYNENPDQSGANTSQVAAEYTRNAAEQFDVKILDGQMADLSDYLSGAKQISIDVWSPAPDVTVQITLENSVLAEPANFPTGRHSVYLGATSTSQAWETITLTFDNQPDPSVANDNVDRIVLLFAPNTNTSDTYYWDNLNAPELVEDPCDGVTPDADIFNDFECNQNVNYVFSHAGVNFRRVVNPDQTGNTSDYVASYTRNSGEENDVIIGFFEDNLALEATDRIQLDVWDPNAPTEVIVSLQNENNDVILEMTATTSTSSAWQTLTYDPSSVIAAPDIAKFVVLFDPGEFSSDTYYFDNFEIGIASSVNDLKEVNSFSVFPNPTQGETTFQYELQTAANVNLSIYDVTGKRITQILNENQLSGQHQVIWNAAGFSNGIYFYTLSVNGNTASDKIVLNR
jgi:hypothetical protein